MGCYMKQEHDEKQDNKRTSGVFSPYMFIDINNLVDDEGNPLPTQPVTSLCHCGSSALQPYFDETHGKIGFLGKKEEGRVKKRIKDYSGEHITIYDHRGVCAYVTRCIQDLPEVFHQEKHPWIDPNGSSVAEVIAAIEKCPSGALRYTIDGELHQDWDNEPTVRVEKNGPFCVSGYI
jgi:uncharacterized Fe-S cluster protein YjdI